jgi:DNA-binding CsgD family transcriptional regulator
MALPSRLGIGERVSMVWGPAASAMPVAAARMARIAAADTPARVRLSLSLALVLTMTVLMAVALVPGPRILFAVLLAPVVTVAIAFGFPTAVWTIVLGVAIGTIVPPPTGVPIVSDPGYPAALVMYLIEGTTLALLGAVAHAALRSRSAQSAERGSLPHTNVIPTGPARTLDPLTVREVEILRLAASGRAPDELARELCVSRNTVKTHLAHAYDKLGAHNRADAIACALREGWLDASDVTAAAEAAHRTD